MTIADRIRNRRLELGLSVDDLAKRLNKNRATVYRYESNYIKSYSHDVMEYLAKALETTPAYLYGYDADTSSNQSADLGAIQPDEADIITTYRSLPAPGKQYVQQQLVAARLMYGEKPADSAAADK